MNTHYPDSGAGSLSNEERLRYSRHLMLPEVGEEGQLKLKRARVLLIGAGGLGSPAALYLAAAGVGHLGIIDSDAVELSNLQRQVLHGTQTIGVPKVESAAARLCDLNPHVDIAPYAFRLTRHNAIELFRGYDIIVDGTDNFPTRYLANDACVLLSKPYVYGSIFRFEGQAGVFWSEHGACYRCLYPQPPPPGEAPSCAEAGVLGVLPGIVGCIQAAEAIKIIIGKGEPMVNRLLLFDALAMTFKTLRLERDPACAVCGDTPIIRELIDYENFCQSTPTINEHHTMNEITVMALKTRLDRGDAVQILDVREPYELAIAKIPGVIHIPLAEVISRQSELDPGRDVVVMCRGGGRSAQAIHMLRHAGYSGPLANLKGGILAWSDQVDPAIPKY